VPSLPPEATQPPTDRDDGRLAILQQLEAGEIDVGEAERRLLELEA
jgi:hypothetical protein